MRTEPPSPMGSALDRLRASTARARRWLAARGTPTRVALLLAGLGVLAAAGYLASVDDPSALAPAWIYEGRRLSIDDVRAIDEALDAEGIPHVSDSSGRVGVRPDRKSEALAALARRKVVPRTLDELSRDLDPPGFWEGPGDRERRERAQKEQKLKALIEEIDPAIVSAFVSIDRVKTRGGLGAPSLVSCFIRLRTAGGLTLPYRVIEGIETDLKAMIPDLRPEAITIADQTGHKYLAAGNPALKEENQKHVQEEDWRDAIARGLQYIPGVSVSVLLESVAPPSAPPEPPPAVAAEAVRPNGPLVLEPEPEPAPASPAPTPPVPRTRANVLVQIPRTFYLLAFQAQSPGRRPTPEDLRPLQTTTEKLVRDAVEIQIPGDILGEVKIDNVQDDLANPRTLLLPPAPESIRPWPWLALAGAIGLSAAVVAAATLVRLATRRPTARPSRSAMRPGYVADGPAGPVPGPSERVRELIRLNPEAAAGVLQRWIGQGGALE